MSKLIKTRQTSFSLSVNLGEDQTKELWTCDCTVIGLEGMLEITDIPVRPCCFLQNAVHTQTHLGKAWMSIKHRNWYLVPFIFSNVAGFTFPLKWRRSPALSVGWDQWQHRALLGWILIMLIHRWNHGVAISIFFPATEQPIHPKSGN